MRFFSAPSPSERVALKLTSTLNFSNRYLYLPDEELAKLVFYSNTVKISRRKLSAASKKSKNLFLQDIAQLMKMPATNPDTVEIRAPLSLKSGAIYYGEWKGNTRHGWGRQIWQNGSYYEGQWKNNCAHGRGRFVYPQKTKAKCKPTQDDQGNTDLMKTFLETDPSKSKSEVDHDGDEYIGEWSMSTATGIGRYIAREGGCSYAGQFNLDKKDGYGIEVLSDGSMYMGEFRSGLRGGPGVLTTAEGMRFSGIWKLGRLSGPGRIMNDTKKSLFEGELLDGMRNGVGRLTIGPTVYQGEFEADCKAGFGEYVWPDGRTYVGGWKDDSMHGAGTLIKDPKTSKSINCAIRYGTVIALNLEPTSFNTIESSDATVTQTMA